MVSGAAAQRDPGGFLVFLEYRRVRRLDPGAVDVDEEPAVVALELHPPPPAALADDDRHEARQRGRIIKGWLVRGTK